MDIVLVTAGIFLSFILMYVSAVFLLSRIFADNSLMDIAYGPAFAVASWLTIYTTQTFTLPALLIAGLITAWALRLFVRIARKNWGKPEDPRYAAWREQWLQHGRLYFILRSFLQVNVLQGLIITIVAAPVIVAIAGNSAGSLPWLIAGTLIFAVGLSYEAIADHQLDRFIARKKAGTEERPLMTEGLFRYSRRPNYFGEALLWWGLAVISLPLPYGYLALFGPALITFIVTRVTGPMLEEQFTQQYPEAYQQYKDQTNYFIPGRPKRN